MKENLLRIKRLILGSLSVPAIGNSCFYDSSKQGIPFNRADGQKYDDKNINNKADTKGHSRNYIIHKEVLNNEY